MLKESAWGPGISLLWLLAAAALGIPSAAAGPGGMEGALRAGDILEEAGHYDEAEAEYRKVLAAEAASKDARGRLARLLSMRGHAALRRGNLYEARRRLEEAVELAPEKADYQFLLGTVLFRQGEYYYALQVAERAVELAPDSFKTQNLLAEILYREGNLEGAVASWERAARSSSHGPYLRTRIDKARREIEVEEGMNREVSRNFTILHEDPVPRVVINSVKWQLEKAFRLLEGELGTSPPGDIVVILYTRVDFHEITGSPRWVGGTFDGKVRVPVGGLASEADAAHLEPVLTHELTHSFLRSIVARRLPLWFEEGLAEYFEGTTSEIAAKGLKGYGSVNFSSFEDLAAGLRGRRGPVEAAYLASALAVAGLIEKNGFRAVRRLLEEVGDGEPFAVALEDETGMDLEEFQELWRKEVSRGRGYLP